jgi:hypothetical protein
MFLELDKVTSVYQTLDIDKIDQILKQEAWQSAARCLLWIFTDLH